MNKQSFSSNTRKLVSSNTRKLVSSNTRKLVSSNKNNFLIGLIVLIIILLSGGIYLLQSGNTIFSFKDSEEFSKSLFNTQAVTEPKIVNLKNGDTYTLTASIVSNTINGKKVKMLAYNGSIPGPILKVEQGSEVTVKFKNDTDVSTTLHSHGLRLENEFDGVPDVTQKEIRPGKEFTYKLSFPDEGIYWYHPHVREDYAQELGLYGNIIVTPSDKNYYEKVDAEETLVLDDILLDSSGIAPFQKDIITHAFMGRFGNTLLINGKEAFNKSYRKGDVVRFYITNVASVRPFQISIPGAKIKLIGLDSGALENEEFVDSVIIAPSERVTIDVLFESAGTFSVMHKTPQRSYTLGQIKVDESENTVGNDFYNLKENAFVKKSINPLRNLFTKIADKNITLNIDMHGMMGGGDHGMHMMPDGTMMRNDGMMMGAPQKIEWEDDMAAMNANSTNDSITWKMIDDDTGFENMDMNWKFKKGDIVKIKIFNNPNSMHPMQHPIHLHGQRFLVVSTNDVLNTNLGWKDTALIQTGDTVELLVEMSNPGKWMIHCHIPEHMESGMMSVFEVI